MLHEGHQNVLVNIAQTELDHQVDRSGCGVDGCGCSIRLPDLPETHGIPYFFDSMQMVVEADVTHAELCQDCHVFLW